ncbi:MAG: hypothetical protein V3U60_16555 [Gammaproteobacteria bacterium]
MFKKSILFSLAALFIMAAPVMAGEARAAGAAAFCLKELANGPENAPASCNPYPNETEITKDNIAEITGYWAERAKTYTKEDAEGPDPDDADPAVN